jgi:phage baseplate assembly protein W
MEIELQSFLGTGWSFPPVFKKEGKNIITVSDEQDIAESVFILLNTTPGERIMRPEYGCGLKKLVFERHDSNFFAQLNHLIYYALLNFEPRINFIDAEVVNIDNLDGLLYIKINYTIIITNTRHNIVFPFYLLEGTNI